MVFLNGLLVAYFFGVQPGTDLFFYVYNSVLIIGAFFTSLNGSVIIPESMRLRAEEGESAAMGFLNFFLCLYIGITVAVLLIVSWHPVSFFGWVSNFKSGDLSNNSILLYLSIPLFAMICIINLCVDILISYKFFTIPMIVGIINGLFSISFMLVFHSAWGIKSVMYGLLISYTLNIVMLIFLMSRNLHWNFRLIKVVKQKRIWKNFGFAQLGNFTSTAASYVPMYILSGFNTGIITALTFAQQISSLPTVLITYQFSAVAGIKFNELYAHKKFPEINSVFTRTANLLHFIMIPASFLIFQFSDEIVEFLLGFTSIQASAAGYVSLFLKYLGLLLPLFVINSLISRLFMASHKIRESFWYQIIFNIVLIILLYTSVKRIGIAGYPIAMVITYLLNLVCCYFLEKKYFHLLDYQAIISEFLKLVSINLAISILVFYLMRSLAFNNYILTIMVAGIVYLVLLLVTSRMLKSGESIIAEFNAILKKSGND